MTEGYDWVASGWMKIPYLPKPEYQLLQAVAKRYGCKDQSEVIATLLRLVYHYIDDAQFVEALEAIRCMPMAERRYDLDALD